MDEFKPCPFCDVAPEVTRGIAHCHSCESDVFIDDWQDRPIEDALRAEIERLKHEVFIAEKVAAALKYELAKYTMRLTDDQAFKICDQWHADGVVSATIAMCVDDAIRQVRADG